MLQWCENTQMTRFILLIFSIDCCVCRINGEPDRLFNKWWYSVIDIVIVTAQMSKLLYSWLLISPSEHHPTTQTSNYFLNEASTMLNNVFNVYCTTPTCSKLVELVQAYGSWTCSRSYHCTVVQFCTILSSAHDVTITLHCVLVWICSILSRTKIVWWMK